jgi:mono/diheme cytochrome c family protein
LITTRGHRLALVGLLGVSLSGCTDWAGYDLDYFWNALPVLSTMRRSITYDPYELPRLPAANSVPFSTPNGDTPAPFAQAQLDSAAATLTNPFAGRTDAALLARGQLMYHNQCFACHGPQGAGNGPVVGGGKFPFAPAINGAATAGRSDGYIYGVMTVGRGLMPPYGEKITHQDRWAVVAYVRQLQAQGGASPAPAAAPAAPAAVAPAPAAPAPGGPGQ